MPAREAVDPAPARSSFSELRKSCADNEIISRGITHRQAVVAVKKTSLKELSKLVRFVFGCFLIAEK